MHENGRVIYEHCADEHMLIASTTKIMTALVAIENSDANEKVQIKPEHCQVEGSSMYLKAGETYFVAELLAGLLLSSGNDAALALADHCAGSEKAFVKMMNDKAALLGLKDSHFENPHGLNAQGHYSSARDLARLMAHCMKEPLFVSICGSKSSSVHGRMLVNHNKLLNMYEGCIAGKTGYTEKAGRCLVSCAERDGMRFICVTLSAPDDWNDHMKLYDMAFSQYSMRDVSQGISFKMPIISASKAEVNVVPEKLCVFLKNDESAELVATMPRFVFAPVKAGESCGSFKVLQDGVCIAEGRLVFGEDLEVYKELRSN